MMSVSMLFSILSQVFPPKPRWTANNIPDLSGKVYFVTGGTSGIGKETVKELLRHNATVYVGARHPDAAEAIAKEWKQLTGNAVRVLALELGNLKSIRSAAKEFQAQERHLHVLINTAGVMQTPDDMLTSNGYDAQFGINVLGHAYLTKLLLPTLLATTDETGIKSRVVSVSSIVHHRRARIDYDTLRGDDANRLRLSAYDRYAQSKYGVVVFANELARRHGDKLVSVSLNPGNIKTGIRRYQNTASLHHRLSLLLLYPPELGALTQLWAATAPETADFNGKYLIPWARVGQAMPSARKPEEGERLWNWVEDQTKNVE
ncbi:NAD(P)-binding protein [Exidia glandulosa HHB12029]|uniref:NAD(P)-binding protein n=1 Tax=Exidia glandulosa HHB12029 TaxID=1314781 RepID=A0A165BV56_EXIGL|nr:NAD(P)-binding protein [Exidia glandulosa HHB12029]